MSAVTIFDGLKNFVSGLGTGRDKSTATSYHYERIDRWQAEQMYASSWAARKAIDLIPEDETREWREWQAEQAEEIYKAERDFAVRAKVNLARKWERLYGGAAILIGTGDPDPTEPFDVTRMRPGDLRYLHVLQRHDMQAVEWDDDIASPGFGKPVLYRVQTGRMAAQVVIHASRLVIFDGMDAPREWRENNDGFGLSVLDYLSTAVTNADTTSAATAALVHEATIDVVKIPELENYLGDAVSERKLIDRFQLAMRGKSLVNTLILGGDETYDRKTTTFAGLPDLMDKQHEVVAAALDMPLTRFMGRSPGGLNATGDNELRNYYDMIRARQQTDLGGTIHPLDEVIKAHVGATDDGVTYEWSPLWVPTPSEKATIEKTQAEVDQIYMNMGVFPADKFGQAIRDKLISEGTYPSLDQHVEPGDLEFIVPEFGGGGDEDERT